ncbi:MAG TPA: ABC transporter permease subunit [Candidatus Acidoferrales bacterium]|nr:ABC transporter permease subunit [Candidatus Acidoferrales bacterium]
MSAITTPSLFSRLYDSRGRGSFPIDAVIFAAVLAGLYALFGVGRVWFAPFTPATHISRSPWSLPLYATYSLCRMGLAYLGSLVFALVYAYIAARNRMAERVLIPLLDILQSIPVLSFLPGVMLAMVALFPGRQLGLELGSVLLIFTGQVWNLAFSFYASLKGLPRELVEASRTYRFGRWQRFYQLELPFGAIGLVWNSLMSVAGGWFFLMACEMFQLGNRDFRLPGLGSYLQTAANEGDTVSIVWGLAAMIVVILLLDQLLWRPLIAWAEKFKFEQVESAVTPQSAVLSWLARSSVLAWLRRKAIAPAWEVLSLRVARREAAPDSAAPPAHWRVLVMRGALVATLVLVLYGAMRAGHSLMELTISDVSALLRGAEATLLRVAAALAIGTLWTVPVGVAIGSRPRLAALAQPIAQVAASVPATALFPVVLLVLLRFGGGMGVAAILLMLLGTQWYLLFNVIAGAQAIPTDLKEVAEVYRFSGWDRWRLLVLPGIFPYLVTGLVTAAGGAWNASIVAEYFHFQGRVLSTPGLGSTISHATDSGNFQLLLASTVVMAVVVVTINRLVWKRLFRLAQTRFALG